MKNRIVLSRPYGQWVATWSGPKAAEIVELFGTATIPTPFLRKMAPETVLARVRALNPGVEVEVSS